MAELSLGSCECRLFFTFKVDCIVDISSYEIAYVLRVIGPLLEPEYTLAVFF